MWSVKVRSDDQGRIVIVQDDDDRAIVITPDQVDILCKHLKEVADDITKPSA